MSGAKKKVGAAWPGHPIRVATNPDRIKFGSDGIGSDLEPLRSGCNRNDSRNIRTAAEGIGTNSNRIGSDRDHIGSYQIGIFGSEL